MSHKWSFLGAHRFYNIEQAVELLTNMSDCEDESTSENENKGDSSDSSEYAPEQHQVRTNSNILMPKETKVSKAKEIPKKGQKVAPKLVDNQSATKHTLLIDQTATTSGEEHVASPPNVFKTKEIPSQIATPKPVDNQSATKAMASNSDMDVEDYYIVEDANESASSKYVPCINYAKDKAYPEDEKNGWVRLKQDTGPPNIYRFEGSCHNYLNLNNYTPGAVFDEFLEGKTWTILSENTNKYVNTKLRQAKDKEDKDPIELLSEGADQNPCARLNKWEDTSLDEMKVFVAHLIVMGILKKNTLFLVRPMVDMMQRNFCTKYRPGKELSLDESMCPFKGRVHFKCYNPKKPNRFHIKLLWSVNLALATFVALKFIQEMHLASHRVMCRKYRMHLKLHVLS